jgi:hypothetical protein
MPSKVNISDASPPMGDLAVNIVSSRTEQKDAAIQALLQSAERKMAFRMLFGVCITILINFM